MNMKAYRPHYLIRSGVTIISRPTSIYFLFVRSKLLAMYISSLCTIYRNSAIKSFHLSLILFNPVEPLLFFAFHPPCSISSLLPASSQPLFFTPLARAVGFPSNTRTVGAGGGAGPAAGTAAAAGGGAAADGGRAD